jgi:uridine phosphorylase
VAKKTFQPEHINASAEDLAGNNGIGRYIFLPGSSGRAEQIANHFGKLTIKPHSRGHNLYLGTLDCNGTSIDVATTHTGMGCPSAEIILHELFQLGGKRFLRVGTAGSLQPTISAGELINAQATVRDEGTTINYAPLEFPAIASLEFTSSIMLAAKKINLSAHLHTGIVHCKNSFYGRQHGAGPRSAENLSYIDLLSRCGVLATEMETATLFIQSQLYNHQLRSLGEAPQHRVLAGAVLAVLRSAPQDSIDEPEKALVAIEQSIQIALETVKILATQELLH